MGLRWGRKQLVVAAAVALLAGAGVVTAPAAGAAPVPNKAKGWDVDAAVTAADVTCLQGKGYTFSMLYTNLSGTNWKTTYSALKSNGMQAILQQGFVDSDLFSSASKGTSTGQTDVSYADSVNYPAGSDFFMDIESTGSASKSTVIDWINNWATQIANAGYTPGVYSGAPSPLTNSDLSASVLPKVKVYWQSESASAADPAQGYVVVQSTPASEGCNLGSIDTDTAYIDKNNNQLVGSAGGGSTSTGTSSPALAVTSAGKLTSAFRAADTGRLWTWTGVLNTAGAGTATYDGMAPGTSPSIAVLPNGNYAVAFHAADGKLWTWTGAPGTAGNGTATLDGMAAGTSPSLAVLPNGNLAVAFHASGSDKLWTWTGAPNTAGNGTATDDGMAAGTSPSLAVLANGHLAVAFNAGGGGKLWTWNGALNTTGNGTATLDGMAAGTSPSLAVLPNGNLAVAFHANSSDILWTWTGALNTTGNGTATLDGMAAGTSPSLAVLANGHLAVAFNAGGGGKLWTWNGALNTTGNGTATLDGMAAGTSPSLKVLANGNLAVAFKADDSGKLWTWNGALNTAGNGTATNDGLA